MMMNTTLEQLRSLKLAGMSSGLQEQLTQPGMTGLSFEERLALLVDREVHWRSDKRQARLLKAAHLKYPQACIEDIDTRSGRGLDRSAVMSLALGNWIESGHSVLITGLTGAGKTWLACALAQYACRRGKSALYQRVPRLGEELRIRHGNGTFGKWLIALAGIDSQTRADLLEIIDDRAGNKATIITSQLKCCAQHFNCNAEFILTRSPAAETPAPTSFLRLFSPHNLTVLLGQFGRFRRKSCLQTISNRREESTRFATVLADPGWKDLRVICGKRGMRRSPHVGTFERRNT
jgi:DNA replication protein DnaC